MNGIATATKENLHYFGVCLVLTKKELSKKAFGVAVWKDFVL